jgi:hypothetical protein
MYVLFTSFTIISIKRIFKETNIFSWKNLCFFKLIGLTHLWFLDRFVVLLSPLMYCVFFLLTQKMRLPCIDFMYNDTYIFTLRCSSCTNYCSIILKIRLFCPSVPTMPLHSKQPALDYNGFTVLTGRPAHQHLTITINQPANNNLTKLFIKLRLVIKEETPRQCVFCTAWMRTVYCGVLSLLYNLATTVCICTESVLGECVPWSTSCPKLTSECMVLSGRYNNGLLLLYMVFLGYTLSGQQHCYNQQ